MKIKDATVYEILNEYEFSSDFIEQYKKWCAEQEKTQGGLSILTGGGLFAEL